MIAVPVRNLTEAGFSAMLHFPHGELVEPRTTLLP